MKRLIIAVLLVLAAWQGYEQYQSRRFARESTMGIADANQFVDTSSTGGIPKQSTSY
jgi:predicted negative regulator of RcsB-dependent stress response